MSLHQRLQKLEGKTVDHSASIWDVISGELNFEELDAEGKAMYEKFVSPEPVNESDPIEAEIESVGLSEQRRKELMTSDQGGKAHRHCLSHDW